MASLATIDAGEVGRERNMKGEGVAEYVFPGVSDMLAIVYWVPMISRRLPRSRRVRWSSETGVYVLFRLIRLSECSRIGCSRTQVRFELLLLRVPVLWNLAASKTGVFGGLSSFFEIVVTAETLPDGRVDADAWVTAFEGVLEASLSSDSDVVDKVVDVSDVEDESEELVIMDVTTKLLLGVPSALRSISGVGAEWPMWSKRGSIQVRSPHSSERNIFLDLNEAERAIRL